MILDLTISLLLKTRRIKLPWTNDELKSLKGIKEISSNASSDAAKRSLMNAFTLTTAIDARILNIPNVMSHIANSDSRVRAAIQGQSAARTSDQPSLDAESTTTTAPNRVFIFTGDYINPTSWTTWDEHNPQWRLINGLKDLQQRKNPLMILDEQGTLAAVEEISINLDLLPALWEGDDVSLAELVLAEWHKVIEENQSVFFELQADIAHGQWTRSRNLRYFPIPESLDESLEGKYRLDDDEESLPDLSDFLPSSSSPPSPTSSTFTTRPTFPSSFNTFDSPLTSPTSFAFSSFTIPHLSAMTPTPTPIVTSFGNIPGIPKRWSDFDEEDDSLPDISDFIATEDKPVSEDEEAHGQCGNEIEPATTAAAASSEAKAMSIPGAELKLESSSRSASTTSSPLQETTEIEISHVEDVSFSSFASDVSSERTGKFDEFGLSLTFGFGMNDSSSDGSRLSLISSPSPITPMTPATIRDGLNMDSTFPFPFPLSSSSQECCTSGHRCQQSQSSPHSCCVREARNKSKGPDDWVRRLSRALNSFRRGLKT